MRVRSEVRDVQGQPFALVRLAPDEGRVLTWSEDALWQFRDALSALETSSVAAVVLTGADGSLGAGADLRVLQRIRSAHEGRAVATAGYAALRALSALPVPTVALLGGTALGGAFEVALRADVRIARRGVRSLGLPEVGLGLVPGWGGLASLAERTGRAAAGRIAVTDSLANRHLDAEDAVVCGAVDAVLTAGDDEEFVGRCLDHVAQLLTGAPAGAATDPARDWDAAALTAAVERRVPGGTDAARAAVALLDELPEPTPLTLRERTAARLDRAREPLQDKTIDVFGQLAAGPGARGAISAFFAVQGARARTRRSLDAAGVDRVGVVGGGLMASQLGTLFALRLGTPVLFVEVDAERAAAARDRVAAQFERALKRGADAAVVEQAIARTSVGHDLDALAGCDVVVEAVFEDLDVKRSVWQRVEQVVDPAALLLTNTSSLSIDAMAQGLDHPGRLEGLHFFNPVAVLPLVEVVRGARTTDETHRRVLGLAARLGKTAVETTDAPGFLVNRLLSRWLGDALSLVDGGEDPAVVDAALGADGLPMTPFQLVQHIGPAVQLHILELLEGAFPDRFAAGASLPQVVRRGLPGYLTDGTLSPQVAQLLPPRAARPMSRAQVRTALLRGLADETDRLLTEGVVASIDDVDAAMVLGAGFPAHHSGLSGLLDSSGASAFVRHRPFRPTPEVLP